MTYVGVRCYTLRLKKLFGHVKKIQRMRAYDLHVTHTVLIGYAYTGYARHSLNTLGIR